MTTTFWFNDPTVLMKNLFKVWPNQTMKRRKIKYYN